MITFDLNIFRFRTDVERSKLSKMEMQQFKCTSILTVYTIFPVPPDNILWRRSKVDFKVMGEIFIGEEHNGLLKWIHDFAQWIKEQNMLIIPYSTEYPCSKEIITLNTECLKKNFHCVLSLLFCLLYLQTGQLWMAAQLLQLSSCHQNGRLLGYMWAFIHNNIQS